MAEGTRIRKDFEQGKLGASLTTSGTTITFASAPGFATLEADEYLAIALVVGKEIVHLTDYVSGATTGTIERAQEGTSASSHSLDADWVHGPTVSDFFDPDKFVFGELHATQAGTINNGNLIIIAQEPAAQQTIEIQYVPYDASSVLLDTVIISASATGIITIPSTWSQAFRVVIDGNGSITDADILRVAITTGPEYPPPLVTVG